MACLSILSSLVVDRTPDKIFLFFRHTAVSNKRAAIQKVSVLPIVSI